MGALKGHWGSRTDDGFLFQVASDFVTQLEEIMESEEIDRTELARKLNISKGRVSQILNDPGNLTLKNIVKYARVLDRNVSIVTYRRVDRTNESGPIPPQVFVTCWQKAGTPTDVFSAGTLTAVSTETKFDNRVSWSRELQRRLFSDEVEQVRTTGEFENDYGDEEYKPSLKDMQYAGTEADQL